MLLGGDSCRAGAKRKECCAVAPYCPPLGCGLWWCALAVSLPAVRASLVWLVSLASALPTRMRPCRRCHLPSLPPDIAVVAAISSPTLLQGQRGDEHGAKQGEAASREGR